MLKRFLKRLRQQPKPIKDHFAMVGAGLFTAFIALVWWYVPQPNNAVMASREEGVTKPFSQLFGSIKNQLSAAQASIAKDLDVVGSVETAGEGQTSTETVKTNQIPPEDWYLGDRVTTTVPQTVKIVPVSKSSSSTNSSVNE